MEYLILYKKQLVKIIISNVLVFFALFSLVEITVALSITAPNVVPRGILLNAIRAIYWEGRDLIQYNPECARYDSRLGYTLRPGTCTFSNAEFSNEFRVNVHGLRDDTESLQAPKIIVVGDSHAMGWGVDQDESFAQIIESSLGIPVLNAGMSSYGTAREFLILNQLNTEKLRFLIVQYSDNDFNENEAFFLNNNRLETMTVAQYKETEKFVRDKKTYYFGKYIIRMINVAKRKLSSVLLVKEFASAGNNVGQAFPIDEYDVRLFLNVILQSKLNLSKVQIVVLHLNEHGDYKNTFIYRLEKFLSSKQFVDFPTNIEPINVGAILASEHYFELDGHLNAKGHRVVAEEVMRIVRPAITSEGY